MKSILLEAQSLVHGDRNSAYGNPKEDYTRTVSLFKTLMGEKKCSEMTPEDGILFMICVKLSREAHLHKTDNLVDICGYAACKEWSHNDPDE
jgi:hypothetical protein